MFEIIRFNMLVEFMRLDHKKHLRGYDWTQEFIKPATERRPVTERLLTAVGDSLIRLGIKLKQRSRARLPAETTQSPNFIIML